MSSANANQPFVFTPPAAPVSAGGTDPLVVETRREIADIVREVAVAVRSDRTSDEFLALLVDRILRAMAAEGVLVWQRCDPSLDGLECARALGRITDKSIPAESIATHTRLLWEVAGDGQPVVVPATPGATDAEVPANPMEVPVALVPIECEPSPAGAAYLLEVFLEPDCGVATQRGYLRFVAQMADLAGEFLRADQLSRLRRGQTLARKVDLAIAEFHVIHDRRKLEAVIVDGAATLFEFDRVGLCRLEPKVTLDAVSHVNKIDSNSPAARQLREAADIEVDADGCAWFEQATVEAGNEEAITVRAVVSLETQVLRSLVCMQVADSDPVPQECRAELVRFMRHADLALRNAARLEAIPGGRLLASLAPVIENRHRGFKPAVLSVIVTTLLIVAAFFPVPLVVYSPATIRPAMVQTIAAPRDAVVEQIHVRHGQEVTRGEKLITLVDPDLDAQITDRRGEQAVLLERQSRLAAELVDTAPTRRDRLEQLESQLQLVNEEIRSIESQLEVLEGFKDSLLICAMRNGIVDAWQIEHRLQSRPIRRGDLLMHVIGRNSPWVVDARVPQSRIAHVQNADHDQNLSARVSLESNPTQFFTATLRQIGPAVQADQDALPATAALLSLGDEVSGMIAARQGTSHQSGAPARVMFRCGNTPAAYLVFQDVIRSLRGALALYAPGERETQSANSRDG